MQETCSELVYSPTVQECAHTSRWWSVLTTTRQNNDRYTKVTTSWPSIIGYKEANIC